jgi:hypothetical protein
MRIPRSFLALFALLGAVAGCPTLPEPVPCGEIPAGGCPIGRGGTCADPTCAGVYDCVDGAWVSTKTCPPPLDGGAGGGEDGGVPDGGPCTPVPIDTSGEALDCTPDLQEPDCPVEAAQGCLERACTTGCVDFYLCTTQGWSNVAYCDDGGTLIILP